MTLPEFIRFILHFTGAEFVRLGQKAPDGSITLSIMLDEPRIKIVLTISVNAEPMKITGVMPSLKQIQINLPPKYEKILAVLDYTTPRDGPWIAQKIHQSYSGSLRTALADLVLFGFLVKPEGQDGYLLK